MENVSYSQKELSDIRSAIEGKIKIKPKLAKALCRNMPVYMNPLSALSATDHALYQKLLNDANVKSNGIAGFFPETYSMFYEDNTAPSVHFKRGTRNGLIAMIKHPSKNVVIKSTQSDWERDIAQTASDLEVGPKQYNSLDGFITEEMIMGDPFTDLKGERLSSDFMRANGVRTAEMLSKLHERDILYNDYSLDDSKGKSHLLIPINKPAVLIDYGVSLNLKNHPNYSIDEAYKFATTTPIELKRMGAAAEGRDPKKRLQDILEENRRRMGRMTKQEITDRDIDFVSSGLFLSGKRWGDSVIEPFRKGFKETYRR